LTCFYVAKSKRLKVFFAVVFVSGLWSLIVSSLRSAFASYLVSILAVTFLVAWVGNGKQTTRQKMLWFVKNAVLVYGVTGLMFVIFGGNLSALLTHGIKGVFGSNSETEPVDQTVITQYELPVPIDQVGQAQLYNSIVDRGKPQSLSGCAKEKEISLCIRLESLWPQAINGFKKEPLLGSGYSTLNKTSFLNLAVADGVDNNYLRILGETGLFGFITFFAIIGRAVWMATKRICVSQTLDPRLRGDDMKISIAYIGIVIGLLGNAFLIDVFAASKVAFTFWALTGLVIGTIQLNALEKIDPGSPPTRE
jgi:O-antigen ligase